MKMLLLPLINQQALNDHDALVDQYLMPCILKLLNVGNNYRHIS